VIGPNMLCGSYLALSLQCLASVVVVGELCVRFGGIGWAKEAGITLSCSRGPWGGDEFAAGVGVVGDSFARSVGPFARGVEFASTTRSSNSCMFLYRPCLSWVQRSQVGFQMATGLKAPVGRALSPILVGPSRRPAHGPSRG
jgi:hypothetical protein